MALFLGTRAEGIPVSLQQPSGFDAGPVLDRMIELRVFGRKPTGLVPPYSTDEGAAELIVARLTRPPLRSMCLKTEDGWTFHWRSPAPGRAEVASSGKTYVRLISASGPTRPLAICRAALKLLGPLDPGGSAPKGRGRVPPDSARP